MLSDCVPVFLEMRDFAPKATQMNLLTYIEQYFGNCRVPDVGQTTRRLFVEGHIFLILDGLDEVSEGMRASVNQHIRDILQPYHQSRYAFSCRLPLELPFANHFQRTIIAPFNAKQRAAYVRCWFSGAFIKNGHTHDNDDVAQRFLERLSRHVNLGELTRTPILLDLLCMVFRDHNMFPPTRTDVYDWGLRSLLNDRARRLRDGHALKQLSIDDTRSLLQKIAAKFFLLPQPQSLFKQGEVEDEIRAYLGDRFDTADNHLPETRRIIEDLELTYGLLIQQAANFCSFSHLTFQEFFTAQYLVNTDQHALVHDHIFNAQWRFVIELVAELLSANQAESFFVIAQPG